MSQTDRPSLRWGVLGTARINRKVIPALQASKNGEVVGIASRDEAKAKEQADKHGALQPFGSYEALLAAQDIDAVYIPLPNALHLEWSVKALEAGKHVLCEKPLAMSAAECEEISHVAQARGLKVLEGFMYRFHPRFELLQRLMQEGVVGELKFIRVAHSFAAEGESNIRWSAELGGGALYDTGCYCVNISRMIAAEEPVQVSAFANFERLANGADAPVDTSVAGLLRFPGGATALFDCGVNLERRNLLEVVGTKGRLLLENPLSLIDEDSVLEEHHFGQDPVSHEVAGENHFVRMAEHFAEAALTGSPLRYDLADAANNLRAMTALLGAAKRAAGQV